MYPTRASSRPLPVKCLRKKCSTPQKQLSSPTLISIREAIGVEVYIYPAANVAFSVVSGRDMPPPIGPKVKLLVEKRRKKREERDGSMNVVARVRKMRRTAAVKIASLSV